MSNFTGFLYFVPNILFRVVGNCNDICNAVEDLSTKICVPSETKDANVKVFNIITRTYETKIFVKNILHVIVNAKFNSTTCNSVQK